MKESPVEATHTPHAARLRTVLVVVFGVLIVTGGAWLLLDVGRAWLFAPDPPREADLAREAHADLERRNYRPVSESLKALLLDPAYHPIPTQAHPLLGQKAPEFTLPAVGGGEWSLAAERAKGPVVLVFYYGYHCNHCVSQLFALHRDIEKFRELGARVVAVSADPTELTEKRFKQYGAFGFPVLSDPGNKVAEQYGTFTPSPKPDEEGDQLHGTFVIDTDGKVVWVNRGDGPFTEDRTLLVEIHRHQKAGTEGTAGPGKK